MNSRQLLLFAMPFALLVAAIVMGFQDYDRAGGVVLVSAGLLCMMRSRQMAAVQNQLNKTGWRFLLGGGIHDVRPHLYILWGVGLNAVGVGWLISG